MLSDFTFLTSKKFIVIVHRSWFFTIFVIVLNFKTTINYKQLTINYNKTMHNKKLITLLILLAVMALSPPPHSNCLTIN